MNQDRSEMLPLIRLNKRSNFEKSEMVEESRKLLNGVSNQSRPSFPWIRLLLAFVLISILVYVGQRMFYDISTNPGPIGEPSKDKLVLVSIFHRHGDSE